MNYKLISSILIASISSVVCTVSGDLLITGVYDGPLSGGTPKGVELYVVNDIADLSQFALGSANNGGGTDGEEFTFPAGSATAGSFIYVTNNEGAFYDYYGFSPDYTSSAMSINGDDAIELFNSGTVIDVFGDIDVDGNGTPWEYLDGWAYRNDGTSANGGVFADADFMFSGPNAVDGCSTNATCSSVMPIGTYSPGGGGPNIIVVEQMGYSFVPDVIDVNIGDTIRWIWGGGDHSVVDSTPGTCDDEGLYFDEDLDEGDKVVEWVVPATAPESIYYICDVGQHCSAYGMTGMIYILDASGSDTDGDGWEDDVDNCPDTPNPGQEDCNGDGVGDACDTSAVDCNGNGVPDDCDILEGDAFDCNQNDIPDSCDYKTGVLHDDNGNGFPDECETTPPFIQLQEIRTDQPGADNDEYFEIRGDQSMDLTGVWYIVIGDGSAGSGVIECAIDLSGMAIPANGSLLVAEDDDTLGVQANYVLPGALNFENSDNVTHFLAMNFYGFPGDDLDSDDDGILEYEPWQETIDGVQLIFDPAGGDMTYLGFESIGPTADGYAPSHAYRWTSACGNFAIGEYDPADPDAVDTPGSENPACPNPCPPDLDGDGNVAVSDILILIGGWGGNDPTHDLDGNGSVGVSDLLLIIAAWGPC
jgi:plastocyanin